jgi:hypothetical protein
MKIIYALNDAENHRYQTSYENSLIPRVFYGNVIVFYGPLIYSFVDLQNEDRFFDMFYIMAVAMAVKQIAYNVFEALYPLIMFKPHIDRLKDHYWSVRADFMTPE